MPAETRNIVDEQGYQFFSCYKCGELISAIELSNSLKSTGVGCRCGCMKVQPRQVKAEEYERLNVIKMALYLGIGVEDYVADYFMEAQSAGLTDGQQLGGSLVIRGRFAELAAAS